MNPRDQYEVDATARRTMGFRPGDDIARSVPLEQRVAQLLVGASYQELTDISTSLGDMLDELEPDLRTDPLEIAQVLHNWAKHQLNPEG